MYYLLRGGGFGCYAVICHSYLLRITTKSAGRFTISAGFSCYVTLFSQIEFSVLTLLIDYVQTVLGPPSLPLFELPPSSTAGILNSSFLHLP